MDSDSLPSSRQSILPPPRSSSRPEIVQDIPDDEELRRLRADVEASERSLKFDDYRKGYLYRKLGLTTGRADLQRALSRLNDAERAVEKSEAGERLAEADIGRTRGRQTALAEGLEERKADLWEARARGTSSEIRFAEKAVDAAVQQLRDEECQSALLRRSIGLFLGPGDLERKKAALERAASMTRRARLELISARNEVERIRELQRVLNVDLQAKREKLADAEARRASASQTPVTSD